MTRIEFSFVPAFRIGVSFISSQRHAENVIHMAVRMIIDFGTSLKFERLNGGGLRVGFLSLNRTVICFWDFISSLWNFPSMGSYHETERAEHTRQSVFNRVTVCN